MTNRRRPHVVALASRKGGVGKTATAVSLAAQVAESGQRCLLVDLDQQGHASSTSGVVSAPGTQGTYLVLARDRSIAEARIATAHGYDLLSGGDDIERAAEHLGAAASGEEHRLKEAIEEAAGDYDVILLDLAPAITIISVAAFVAADSIIVPCTLEPLALDGLAKIDKVVRKLAARQITQAKIAAILQTRFDLRSGEARVVHQELVTMGGTLLLRGTVRQTSYIATAGREGVPITKWLPKCDGAEDYRAVYRELVERGIL